MTMKAKVLIIILKGAWRVIVIIILAYYKGSGGFSIYATAFGTKDLEQAECREMYEHPYS